MPYRRPADRIARPGCIAVLGALLTISACSRHAATAPDLQTLIREAQQHAQAQGAAQSAQSDDQDPCSLLEPAEVQTALGAPLATPPYRSSGNRPDADGEMCTYEDAQFHQLLVDVDWDGAAQTWKLLGNLQSLVNAGPTKGMLHLADGSDIAGTWDEARVRGCCTFTTLLGDQGVTIDASGSNVPIAAAAKLADAALMRLSKPLSINGAQGVQAAIAYNASHRPRQRDPCSLVSRADAEALLGAPLISAPISMGDHCDYELPPQGIRQVYDVNVVWSGGFSAFHEDNALLAGFAKGILPGGMSGAGAGQIRSALGGVDLPPGQPWEAAHQSITGIAAVRNDVMVSIDTRGVNARLAVKLLQKAMADL
jgi:hypothetical protein